MWKKLLISTINPNVVKAEYAVRGAIVLRAAEFETKLRKGEKIPFEKFYNYNIGNPQLVGMKPLSFGRQVLSFLLNPDSLSNPAITSQFPQDVIERSKFYIQNCKGGIGAYSESKGHRVIREQIAKYIEQRDGIPGVDVENIFLTKGGSNAVEFALQLMIEKKTDALLTPIPQYPLYSALITLYGGSQVGYYLDSKNDEWTLNVQHIKQRLQEARTQGLNVRGIVVINPNNPAGCVYSEEVLSQIVDLAEQEGLPLIADEVYQDNIWDEKKKFHSFREIVLKKKANVELFSVHSISKGFYGECGIRGGYLECINIDPEVVNQIYKLSSISLCSGVDSQVMMGVTFNQPKKGDPSYPLYKQEKQEILANMKRIAGLVYEKCNSMTNVQTNKIEGAMYAFPEIKFSSKALAEAKRQGKSPDLMYCLELLENTGIMFVPGSGFGQKPETYHLRTTILGSYEMMEEALEKWKNFNEQFHRRFE